MNLSKLTAAQMQFLVTLVVLIVLGVLLALGRVPDVAGGALYLIIGWWLPSPAAGPRPAPSGAPVTSGEEERNGR